MTNEQTAGITPRQRVLAAIAHRETDRVPFSWGFGPTPEMARCLDAFLAARGMNWPRLREATEEIASVPLSYTGPALPPGTDIWGIGRRAIGKGPDAYAALASYPLAGVESVSEVDAYPWPDPDAFDYEAVRPALQAADPGRLRATKFAGGGNPFEIYCWMTGLEEAMVNLLANPAVVTAALERITGFFEARLSRLLACAGDHVDLVFLADDLGSQQGLLMSRATYRKMLQPFHARLTTAVHAAAPHARVLFHSDGAVFDILPDLLDAGVDILEAVQLDAAGMDPVALKRSFGDRLAFHGGISVQQLLPHADSDTVKAECRRILSILGRGGGYIAAPTHVVQVGTPPENVLAMLEAVLGDADYHAACARAD